jgi:hypothetical protein
MCKILTNGTAKEETADKMPRVIMMENLVK